MDSRCVDASRRGHRLLAAGLAVAVAIAGGNAGPAMAIGPDRTERPPARANTVDDFLAFRRTFGLSVDRSLLATLTEPSPSWGVPLTSAEEAELGRRLAIQDQLGKVLSAGELYAQAYGGLYIDQPAGGIIDIALTADSAAIRDAFASAAPAGAELRFRLVRHTLEQLGRTHDTLTDRMLSNVGTAGAAIRSVSTNVVTNVVDVGLAGDATSAARDELIGLFGDQIQIVDGLRFHSAACNSRFDCTPYRAGLEIYRAGGSCTGGFMAKDASRQWWLTAGHCGPIDSAWKHNEVQVGVMKKNSYDMSFTADAAAITRSGSNHAWIWITTSVKARPVTSRQGHNADVNGESVCQSGISTGFICGAILDVDLDFEEENGRDHLNQRLASYITNPGDSGGPVFYGNKAKGLVSGYFGDPSDRLSVYSHVWEVENQLGVTVLTE